MTQRRTLVSGLLACLTASNWLGLSGSALASPPEGRGQGKGHGKGHGKDEGEGRSHDRHEEGRDGGDLGAMLSVSITAGQAREHARSAGLKGYKPLPPGIRKNLARGKRLPPGIARQQPPAPLLQRLPHYPGHEWQVCGTDLVLVAAATLVVVAVLDAVMD